MLELIAVGRGVAVLRVAGGRKVTLGPWEPLLLDEGID